jgi:hypothetical protein
VAEPPHARATVRPWDGFGHPRLAEAIPKAKWWSNHPKGHIKKQKSIILKFYYLFFKILNNILSFFNK